RRLGHLLPRVLRRRDGEAVDPPARGDATAGAGHVDGLDPRREEHDDGERARGPTNSVERRKMPLYTRRMDERALQKDLDRQIVATHRRFVKAMDGRLGSMSVETKERYFGVLSNLVEKPETTDKPLRDVMNEMMSDAMSVILQEMQR